MSKPYKFKFSIVTAVYNTQEYVSDAIDSVINQSIGFKDNVQLILVNDGSKDKSGDICKEYRDKYPNNIIYIEKENGGVSSARNKGLEKVEGKYVNFLDSDDKLSKNTLEEVWKFFEEHYDEIDFVSIPTKFFEANNDEHPLNYKYKKTHIVNIFENTNDILLFVNSAFIKKEKAQNFKFDQRVHYSEDAKYISMILLEKGVYGALSSPFYLYRKRSNQDSAIQTKSYKKTWLLDTPQFVYMEIMEKCVNLFNGVPLYFQNLIMHDLQFRFKQDNLSGLNEKEISDYFSKLSEILQFIDDQIILSKPFYYIEHKIFCLTIKHKIDYKVFFKKSIEYDGNIFFNGNLTIKKDNHHLFINSIDTKSSKIVIDGIIKTVLPLNDFILKINSNGITNQVKLSPLKNKAVLSLDKEVLTPFYFKVEIPSLDLGSICFKMKIAETEFELPIEFLRGLESGYKNIEEKNFKLKKTSIQYAPKNIFRTLKLELVYWRKLFKKKKLKVIIIRALYFLLKNLKRDPIWIFSDKLTNGGDNGEVLFEYAMKQKDSVKKFFLINKNSKDYLRIGKIGNLLDFSSLKYKMVFLLSDKVLSSQATDKYINAFGRSRRYYNDLYNFDFVFLQHGITYNNLSRWLIKIDKNIKLFITCTEKEYNSILDYEYLYEKENLLLSGFPRYDKLENKPKRKILLMPTWRLSLSTTENSRGEKKYNPKFKESSYYTFFNNLINNERLLESLKKNNYYIKFCLHPELLQNAKDFDRNESIEIVNETCNYQKEFKEGCLLITDYSSVSFDFAYLFKPIIYTQFDQEEFFKNHTVTKGYFDYKKDGFGPVCFTLEETINKIIKFMENECELPIEYNKRIKNLFKYTDKNNCERVYNAVKKL